MYNAGEYIQNTLKSIINQNFDSFEIIVIDDGSTDNSYDLIKNTFKNSQIPHKIIRQENSGVSIARNVGISEAAGEYLVFVDGDDYITPNHLSTLYNGTHDFALTQLVKKHEGITSKAYEYSQNIISTEEFIKMELLMEMPFNFSQLMYKSSIIKDNNIKFPENVIYGEDTHFALQALIHGKYIAVSNEITYHYIQHPESAIQTSQLKRFEIVKVFESLEKYYRKNNRNDLADLIITSRIPKAIFGNMNFFFHNNYNFNEINDKMKELDLFYKLSKYRGSKKFAFKIRLFLLNPKLYYKIWMKFKNSID